MDNHLWFTACAARDWCRYSNHVFLLQHTLCLTRDEPCPVVSRQTSRGPTNHKSTLSNPLSHEGHLIAVNQSQVSSRQIPQSHIPPSSSFPTRSNVSLVWPLGPSRWSLLHDACKCKTTEKNQIWNGLWMPFNGWLGGADHQWSVTGNTSSTVEHTDMPHCHCKIWENCWQTRSNNWVDLEHFAR